MQPPKHILATIVLSQFCCTSLWFAGNALTPDLILAFELSPIALGYLISAVQLGFISGTLLFAIFTISDRYSASKVFFICALLGALFNAGIIWEGNSIESIVILRFGTGFFLAGIYPVGMKIAADYYSKGLGKSLGYLVGALVIGTAFPHLLNGFEQSFHWKSVIISTSLLATLGGLAMFYFVPDGPFIKKGKSLNISSSFQVFKNKPFRAAAFGYFGHMWELYAFWVFVPVMLKTYQIIHPSVTFNVSIISFSIIAIGGLACVLGGLVSLKFGIKRIAFITLFSSGLCCLLFPLMFQISSSFLYIGFLHFWGMVVVADSPLFSTLVAQNATAELKGTALTIVNCIGFSITVVSIQILNVYIEKVDSPWIYTILALGPILGLIALATKKKTINSF